MIHLQLFTENGKVTGKIAESNERAPFRWQDKLTFSLTKKHDGLKPWPSLLKELQAPDALAFLDLMSARFPLSKNFEALREICPDLTLHRSDDEWVFFGGTFHPWHQGHQACLDLLPDSKTCFILPDKNPWKEARDIDAVSVISELAEKIRPHENQFLCPTFLLEKGPNPTMTWIERIHCEFPEKKLSLLLGFDSFSQIKGWTRAHELLNLLSGLYVVSRMEEERENEIIGQELKSIAPGLTLFFLGRHEYERMSSTELRKTYRQT